MSQAVKWILALFSIFTVSISAGVIALKESANSKNTPGALIFVAPHADDEFQFWSLVEESPLDFKIFLTLTRSEETGFCEPEAIADALQQDLGEVLPSPQPLGRWTSECAAARTSSLIAFYEQMGETNTALPQNLAEPITFMLDAPKNELCKMDGDETNCSDEVREALVWLDAKNRGAVIVLNLGDGDLTGERVSWALNEVLENLTAWGVPEDYPVKGMVGAYAHPSTMLPCFDYPHPDHLAVHEALYNTDFSVGPQLGATCFTDWKRGLTRTVSKNSSDSAFTLGPEGERQGAHEKHYGWLHWDTYPVSDSSAKTLFHRNQSFWVR